MPACKVFEDDHGEDLQRRDSSVTAEKSAPKARGCTWMQPQLGPYARVVHRDGGALLQWPAEPRIPGEGEAFFRAGVHARWKALADRVNQQRFGSRVRSLPRARHRRRQL